MIKSVSPSVSVQHDKPPFSCEWVYSTKEMVDRFLSYNTRNRPQKNRHMRRIVSSIGNGRWIASPDAIAISDTCVLLNGQHRLEAIKAAGYPKVALLVVTGLPDSSMAIIDRGVGRTMRDTVSLLLNSAVNSRLVAALNWLHRIKTNQVSQNQVDCDPSTLLDYLETYRDIINELMPVVGRQRSPVFAAIIDYASRDFSKAIEFSRQIAYGEEIVKSDPSYRAREAIKKLKGGGHVIQQQSFAIISSAIDKHYSGKKVKRLRSIASE